jgi:hypothetical protein
MSNVLLIQNNAGGVAYINMELVEYADVSPRDKKVSIGRIGRNVEFAVAGYPASISIETYNYIVTKLNQWAVV